MTWETDERIAYALERIATLMEPDHENGEAERQRVLHELQEASKLWRYRNICFDDMDRILTAVVPLGTVERALHKVLVAKPGTHTMDRAKLYAKPAIGETEREDAG